MDAKNIVVQRVCQAMNIDALNRSFVSETDVENGMVFASGGRSTTRGEDEVFTISKAAAGALNGLWMAYEPEVVVTNAGDNINYKGLNPDIRYFYNEAGKVFSAFKPQVGDIITLTGGGVLLGTYTKGTSTHVNATASSMGLTWGTSATANALSLKLLNEDYVSLTDGSVIGGTGRVPAFTFEVVSN